MAFTILLATAQAAKEEATSGLLPKLRFSFIPFDDGKVRPFRDVFPADKTNSPPYPEYVLLFPAAGSITTATLNVPASGSPFFLFSKFEAKDTDDDVGFSVGPVIDGESLTLVAAAAREFVGTVLHGPKFYEAKQACIARCPNGEESHHCVRCRTSKHTVRVCC